MRRAPWSIAALLLLTVSAPGPAQPPAAKKGAFETVIKQPTGRNGYEELVLAGDLLRANATWTRYELESNATLSRARDMLLDRQIAQVLRLVQQGLQKPFGAPREQYTFETLTPEFAGFRSIARLLAAQEYVFFADGRIADALANARLGLRLGQVVQTDTMISGLVGVAVGAICIRPLGEHLEQLSARDAETLYQLCLEWLRQPSPEVRLVEMERRAALSSLERFRGQPVDRLIHSTNLDPKPKPDDDDRIRQSRQFAAELRQFGASGPAAVDQLYADAAKRIDSYYQKLLAECRRPLWERHYPELPDEGPIADRLAAALVTTATGVGNTYARDQARIRVLACHAAVLRYRWEKRKLPPSLAELGLGELAMDPFTGQPLEYQTMGSRYRLVSAGPETTPDNPRSVAGRLPVSVTPDD
jgi:hypothetical protein